MVRWGQAALSTEALKTAMAVFRPDLYDAALGRRRRRPSASTPFGAFAGPAFDPAGSSAGYLASFEVGRRAP